MKATISTLAELSRRDLQAWAELAENATEPNPFMHPDFVGLAATALRPRGLRILHCEDAGGWAACLPVIPTLWRRDALGPGLQTWRHEYCYLGTPLVAAGATDNGVRALLETARARRGAAYLACDLVRDGPVADAMTVQAATTPVVTNGFTRGFVRRPAAPQRAMAPQSRQRTQQLRRKRRTLSETLGADLEVVVHEDVVSAAQTFLELEASGWKGRAGTAMAAQSEHSSFLVALCEAFAPRDAVQFISLQGGGRAAAMLCNLRDAEGLFRFKPAYDEALARHSPGVQLEVAALELLEHDERAAWMDSCTAPDNEMTNRLLPERTTISTLLVPAGQTGRATVAATPVAMGVARTGRRRLRAWRPG